MRKNKITLLIFSFVMLVCLLISNPINVYASNVNANADVITKSNAITTTLAISERYSVLESAQLPEDAEDIGGYNTSVSNEILKDMLLKIYKDYDSRYTSNYLRQNMFQNFTMLDLSNLVQGTSNVIDLSGIKYLNLQNLKVLKLADNNIESFDITDFPGVKTQENENGTISYIIDDASPVKSLETLDLSNNTLSGTFDATHFENLTHLYLGNNAFNKILFPRTQEGECLLDYRNNKISSMSNITLPEYGETTLILFGNPIEKIETIPTNISIEIGFTNLTNKTTSSTKVKYMPFETLQMEVKLYTKKVSETDFVTYEEYEYTLDENSELVLPAGVYKISYVDKTSQEEVKSNEVTVRPDNATYVFKVGNKTVTTKPAKFSKKSQIVFTSPNENAKVYYRYSSSTKWNEGTVCDLSKKSGEYMVYVKTVENGVESTPIAIPVQVSYSGFLPDFAIIIIIIVVLLVLGFVVVPLIKKLLDKMSKPNT